MEQSAKGAKCDFVRISTRGPRLGLRSQIKDSTDVAKVAKDGINVTIKRESSDDDFKEYAETAMNELLGWYGYANNNKPEGKYDLVGLRRPPVEPEVLDRAENPEPPPPKQVRMESRLSSANSSGSESPKSAETCGWCGKPVEDTTGLSSNDALFCSELCFSQSRRANFKKNKTCDWCKHVRHTVSYVDFQDGASQLQFCSDKCLNQYKMHIFCRETRAHLEMHPHLLTEDSSSGLITPDLWMRNCRSPSSRASSPPSATTEQTSPLPLITVTHPSKLLSASRTVPPICGGISSVVNTSCVSGVLPLEKDKNGLHPRRKRLRKRPRSKPIANEEAQDLRVNLRRRSNERIDSGLTSNQFPELAARLCSTAPSLSNSLLESSRITDPKPCRIEEVSSLPSTSQPHSHIQHTPSLSQPLNIGGLLPPMTVMVPYPILLPVPIPIPIPLPISAFLAAAKPPVNGETSDGNPSKTLQSEDEEIVVDDDTRFQNNVLERPQTEELEEPQEIQVTRLRKRAHEIPPPETYKHKKSLSV